MSDPLRGYKWKVISDLPADLDRLRDRELESLCEVWAKEKESIGNDTRVTDFSAELAREWAIETGIVEGVYTLDRGITQTLIERGIDSAYIPHNAKNRDPELVARIIQNHADVLEGLFAFVTGERLLSTSYIAVAYFQVGSGEAVSISEDVFRISYQEPQSEIVSRFEKWLEPCIVEGIAQWRRTLV